MLKTATIYRLPAEWAPDHDTAEQALAASPFTPCGATQEKSTGWVPPRGDEHGALMESIGGHWIAKLMIETKSVPGATVRAEVDRLAAKIERSTGRKPGRKERKEIAGDALRALLPKAFPKQAAVLVWIDPKARLLVIDASSQGKTDEAITALVKSIPGLSLSMLQTQQSPQSAMTQWLTAHYAEELPPTLSVERECVLESSDESKATVKFSRHNLATDETRQHIAEGKLPTSLAMSWNGRVGFTLTNGLQIKKIKFLDGIDTPQDGERDDAFDADVAIMTGELSALLRDLIEALGGDAA